MRETGWQKPGLLNQGNERACIKRHSVCTHITNENVLYSKRESRLVQVCWGFGKQKDAFKAIQGKLIPVLATL